MEKQLQKAILYKSVLLILIFFLPLKSYGINQNVSIEANVIEKTKDGKVVASGDVQVHFDDSLFKTFKVIYDPKTKKIYLKKYFYIKTPDLEMKGSEGWWDTIKNEGEVYKVKGIIQDKYFIKAGALIKEDGIFYIENGEFSMCPFNQYDWYFKASKISLKKEDYARAKNLTLRFFKVPVIYIPYFLYPLAERKTGFLVPTIAQDTYNDIILKIPFFYVINRNSDITLTYDFRNKQGNGIDLNYRNRFNKKHLFNGDIFYFSEKDLDVLWKKRDTQKIHNRWRIKANTSFDFGKKTYGYFQFDLPSDPFFFEDFYNDSSLRYLSYTKSQLLIFHNNKYFTAELNFDYLYDLTKETNEETLQRLPEIRLYLKERKIKYLPLYVDFLSVNTNFFREEGEKGWRSDNILRLNNYSYWWRYSNRFTISPRITNYSSLENTKAKEGTRKLLIVEDVVRTTTVKQYKNFIHQIIPEIKFTYISKSNQEDFPLFDKEDRIDSFKDIDFTLFNILSFKNEDFLRWTISFGYTFLGKYKISENFFDGSIKPLKNSFYFKIGKFSGENNTFFDFKRGVKRSITSLDLPITNWFKYTINHSYDRGLTFAGEEFHQLGQSVTFNIKNIELYGSILNNIKEGFVQQKRFYIALDRKCWKLKLKYVEDFNKETNKMYSSFLIAINLLNIEYALPFLKPKWRQQPKS